MRNGIIKGQEQEAPGRSGEQRLQALVRHLVRAEAESRQRLARQVHDTVAQSLSLASLRLGRVVKQLDAAGLPREAQTLGEVRALLGQAVEECRHIMADFAPLLLPELGFRDALLELGRQLEGDGRVRISVEASGTEGALTSDLRGLLFHSVRELVQNAIRHGVPRAITVSVRWGVSEVVIAVADDGRGFAAPYRPGGIWSGPGFGLFCIEQCLAGVGGRMTVDSTPGGGAVMTLVVPVAACAGA
jgi:signal transduction histidine kinase